MEKSWEAKVLVQHCISIGSATLLLVCVSHTVIYECFGHLNQQEKMFLTTVMAQGGFLNSSVRNAELLDAAVRPPLPQPLSDKERRRRGAEREREAGQSCVCTRESERGEEEKEGVGFSVM